MKPGKYTITRFDYGAFRSVSIGKFFDTVEEAVAECARLEKGTRYPALSLLVDLTAFVHVPRRYRAF